MAWLDTIDLIRADSDVGLKPIYIHIRKTRAINWHGHLRRLVDKLKEDWEVIVREHDKLVEIIIELD